MRAFCTAECYLNVRITFQGTLIFRFSILSSCREVSLYVGILSTLCGKRNNVAARS